GQLLLRRTVGAEVLLHQRRLLAVVADLDDAGPCRVARADPRAVVATDRIDLPLLGLAADAFVRDVARTGLAGGDERVAEHAVGADRQRLAIDREVVRRRAADRERHQVRGLWRRRQLRLDFLPRLRVVFEVAFERTGRLG